MQSLANAVTRMLHDETARRSMGEAARERAQLDFSDEKMSHQYAEILGAVAGS